MVFLFMMDKKALPLPIGGKQGTTPVGKRRKGEISEVSIISL